MLTKNEIKMIRSASQVGYPCLPDKCENIIFEKEFYQIIEKLELNENIGKDEAELIIKIIENTIKYSKYADSDDGELQTITGYTENEYLKLINKIKMWKLDKWYLDDDYFTDIPGIFPVKDWNVKTPTYDDIEADKTLVQMIESYRGLIMTCINWDNPGDMEWGSKMNKSYFDLIRQLRDEIVYYMQQTGWDIK